MQKDCYIQFCPLPLFETTVKFSTFNSESVVRSDLDDFQAPINVEGDSTEVLEIQRTNVPLCFMY